MVATPASTSAWQLAQRSTHFITSTRAFASERASPRLDSANAFSVGSTW